MDAKKDIQLWMMRNIKDHIDSKTGEVNCTSLVEAWDNECSTGEATLDEDHPAWDIAVEVEEDYMEHASLMRDASFNAEKRRYEHR